jgi:hypothetical protein
MGVVSALKCHKDVRPVSRITDLTHSLRAALLTDAASYLKWLGSNCPVVLFSGVDEVRKFGRAGWKKESEEGNK